MTFPLPGEAQLVGSTLGGSAVKLGWIGRGFCLELLQGGHRVVTTRVRGIRVIARADPLHRRESPEPKVESRNP